MSDVSGRDDDAVRHEVRRALEAMGDPAMPPPTFDDLSVRELPVGVGEGPGGRRRWYVGAGAALAAAAAVVAVALIVGGGGGGGVGDRDEPVSLVDDPESSVVATTTPEPTPAPNASPSPEPEFLPGPSWTIARTNADGTELLIVSSDFGGDDCQHRGHAIETETEVRVELEYLATCSPAMDWSINVRVPLEAPLGDRALLDSSGTERVVIDGALLARPTWIPDGLTPSDKEHGEAFEDGTSLWSRTWFSDEPCRSLTLREGDPQWTATTGPTAELVDTPTVHGATSELWRYPDGWEKIIWSYAGRGYSVSTHDCDGAWQGSSGDLLQFVEGLELPDPATDPRLEWRTLGPSFVVGAVRTDEAGRELVLTVTGGGAYFPLDPCSSAHRTSVRETSNQVFLTIEEAHPPPTPGQASGCTAGASSHNVRVQLAEPLGQRELTLARGEPLDVVHGIELADASGLPAANRVSEMGGLAPEGWQWTRWWFNESRRCPMLSLEETTRSGPHSFIDWAEAPLEVHGVPADFTTADNGITLLWSRAGINYTLNLYGCDSSSPLSSADLVGEVLALADALELPEVTWVPVDPESVELVDDGRKLDFTAEMLLGLPFPLEARLDDESAEEVVVSLGYEQRTLPYEFASLDDLLHAAVDLSAPLGDRTLVVNGAEVVVSSS